MGEIAPTWSNDNMNREWDISKQRTDKGCVPSSEDQPWSDKVFCFLKYKFGMLNISSKRK